MNKFYKLVPVNPSELLRGQPYVETSTDLNPQIQPMDSRNFRLGTDNGSVTMYNMESLLTSSNKKRKPKKSA